MNNAARTFESPACQEVYDARIAWEAAMDDAKRSRPANEDGPWVAIAAADKRLKAAIAKLYP